MSQKHEKAGRAVPSHVKGPRRVLWPFGWRPKQLGRWPSPEELSAVAATLSAVAVIITLVVLREQTDLVRVSQEPVVMFHVGIAHSDPMPSREEMFIRPDSSIVLFNAGHPMLRLRVDAFSMLILRDMNAGNRSDAIVPIPITYWWYPWRSGADSSGIGRVKWAPAHETDMRSVPHRNFWPEGDTTRFRVQNVVHLVRLWYLDESAKEHRNFFLVTRETFAPLASKDGPRLWRDMDDRYRHGVVADIRTDSTKAKDGVSGVSLPDRGGSAPLTEAELGEIARLDRQHGRHPRIKDLDPDAVNPFER